MQDKSSKEAAAVQPVSTRPVSPLRGRMTEQATSAAAQQAGGIMAGLA